jgi:hypothetical protein
VTVLAAAPANAVVPGILGFLVVAGMAIALFFLLRSMNKQLRKVVGGPGWRQRAQDGQPGPAAGPDGMQNGAGGDWPAAQADPPRGQGASTSP